MWVTMGTETALCWKLEHTWALWESSAVPLRVKRLLAHPPAFILLMFAPWDQNVHTEAYTLLLMAIVLVDRPNWKAIKIASGS